MMLKNYKDFLLEFDLGMDVGGGDEEKKGKEDAPDPEEEIAKEKKKRRKKAEAEREKKLDAAEVELKKIISEAPQDFRSEFEKEIMKALEEDDRVMYHTLVLNIQRWQMPKAKDQDEESIEKTAPVIRVLQRLNQNEYRG